MNIQYIIDNVFQFKEYQEKQKQSVLLNYGVKNISQLPLVKAKKRETCVANFGIEIPMQFLIYRGEAKGWKVLRVSSEHKLLAKKQLINSLNKFLQTTWTYTEIILDDWRAKSDEQLSIVSNT